MGFFGGGGGGGTVGPGTTNTVAKFTAADEVGDSQITETSGRDNVPALSGGDYDAEFFGGSSGSGWTLQAGLTAGAAYTPTGLLVVVNESDAAASATGAVVGVFDTRTSGSFGSISALNLDTIKTGNGVVSNGMTGISLYVWNQGSGNISSQWGITISMESDGGTVTGDVFGVRIASPFVTDVDGRCAAINILNQTTNNAAGGSFAIYYEAPNNNTFSVAADGHLQVGATITPPATVGAQTIDKNAGSVNFAALATSLVVTCDKCTPNSLIIATVATNDATLRSVQAVAGSGSFTLFANASATAETRVNFWILNA